MSVRLKNSEFSVCLCVCLGLCVCVCSVLPPLHDCLFLFVLVVCVCSI